MIGIRLALGGTSGKLRALMSGDCGGGVDGLLGDDGRLNSGVRGGTARLSPLSPNEESNSGLEGC